MNEKQTMNCPDANVLKEFLQGRLEPPNLHVCESHIADCEICHETLRGLDANDTLSQYVVGAMDKLSNADESLTNSSVPENSNDSVVQAEDDQEVACLVERLLSPNQIAIGSERNANGPIPSHAESEMLADRAAEVLRYVSPAEDGIGLGSIGNYQLTRLIGAGSTGVVFQAIDKTLDRNVALKVLRPSLGSIARERFIAEARVAASIEHNNVVTIYQVGQEDRLAFIAMQWLPGQTLEDRLASQQTLDEDEIRQITQQVAAGLSAAHQKQLVHRDIKPANIWICEDSGEIKILDFGLARIGDDDPGLTATGMLAGTPNFMSPEQARGLELDGRSDLFSLGCVMYRLLTGRLPFGSPTVLATLQAIQNEQPLPPTSIRRDVSNELSDLTMALLEKQPANRPASADQLIGMLESDRKDWPVNIVEYALGTQASDSSFHDETRELVPTQKTIATKPIKSTQPAATSSFFHGGRWIAATLLAAFGIGGVWFAPQIIRVVNDQGELVIKTNDDDIEIEVLQEGKLIRVLDTKTKRSFNIRSGDYEIKARPSGASSSETNSFDVSPGKLSMSRGGKTVVTVTNSRSIGKIGTAKTAWIATPESVVDRDDLSAVWPLGSKLTDRVVDPNASQTDDTTEWRTEVAKEQIGLIESDNQPQARNESAEQELATAEENPIFNGRTFEQWLSVAKRDRHPKTIADALVACSQLITTPDEKTNFTKILRNLVRKHGSNIIGGNSESATFHYAFMKSFSMFEPDELIDFVILELKEGTEPSRKLCQWLVLIGSVYEGNVEKQKLHREAIVKRAIPLVEIFAACDQTDETLNRTFGCLTGTLQPWTLQPWREPTADLGDAGLFLEIDRLNPKFRQWVKDKYMSDLFTSTPMRSKLGSLANKYFPQDNFLFAYSVNELFDDETSPSFRDAILDQILNFEIQSEKKAVALLLVIQNQFESEGDTENAEEKKKLRHKLMEMLEKVAHVPFIPHVDFARRLEFKAYQEMMFNSSGVVPPMMGGGIGGGFGGGGGGELGAPQTTSGAPSVVRKCLTLLWEYESECDEKFSRKVIGPAVDEILRHYKTEIETVYFKPDLEPLKILDDMMELVKVAKSRGQETAEKKKADEQSPFQKEEPGSVFIQQARQNPLGGGFGGGGQGGGGVF